MSSKEETKAVLSVHFLQCRFYRVCDVYYFVFLFCGDGECFHCVSPHILDKVQLLMIVLHSDEPRERLLYFTLKNVGCAA